MESAYILFSLVFLYCWGKQCLFAFLSGAEWPGGKLVSSKVPPFK